jgi:hypothetical protein
MGLVWRLVVECETGVLELSHKASALRHYEQTELLELLLWLENTKRHLRRSVRRAAFVPVLLRSGSPENQWQDKTETLQLSRHGTALRCQRVVKAAEVLFLVRLDTGRETKARVVWTKQKQHEIGVEHLGRENFWGWDWTTDDTHFHNAPIYLDSTKGEGSLDFILATVEGGDQPRRAPRRSVSSPMHSCSRSSKVVGERSTNAKR